jgi:hypothetical protein
LVLSLGKKKPMKHVLMWNPACVGFRHGLKVYLSTAKAVWD